MNVDFDIRIVVAALVALAFFVFVVAPPNTYEPYLAAGIAAVGVYIWMTCQNDIVIFTDPKKLYEHFEKTATGRFPGTVPAWEDIPPDERVIIFRFPVLLLIWWENALRRACALNAVVDKDKPTIFRLWSEKVTRQAVKEFDEDAKRIAFGTDAVKSEQKMIDFLRKKGYRITYPERGSHNIDQEVIE